MLERWGFDKQSQINLISWAGPWLFIGVLLGIALGFVTLFTVPSAPLWAFSLGLTMITADRIVELIREGKL